MSFFVSWMIWLFAPTLCVVLLACLLSALRIKPPKKQYGEASWFPDEKDY